MLNSPAEHFYCLLLLLTMVGSDLLKRTVTAGPKLCFSGQIPYSLHNQKIESKMAFDVKF